MARAFGSRSVALGAAALCAISPLIQSYAQETRVYIFLILALVISVGATVRAGQRPERRTALLTVGAVSAFLSMWLHYTAISVLLPLAVWVGTRPQLSRRARVAFIAACLLGVGTVMPLLLEQYSIFPNGGAIDGQINWNHAISVIGTPFGYRLGTPIDGETVGGALVVLFAIAALLLWRRRPIAERGLLVSLGVVGIVGIFILDFTGTDPQVASAYNLPSGGIRHTWLTIRLMHFALTLDPSIPINAGLFEQNPKAVVFCRQHRFLGRAGQRFSAWLRGHRLIRWRHGTAS